MYLIVGHFTFSGQAVQRQLLSVKFSPMSMQDEHSVPLISLTLGAAN